MLLAETFCCLTANCSELTAELARRAERAGYKALAITVDTPVLGRREADVRGRFKLPNHLTMANFAKAGGSHAEGTKDGGKDSVRLVLWQDSRKRVSPGTALTGEGVSWCRA